MINGIVNVHKEAGFTSHDVVAKLRGIFGQKKIGHTGTLDPDATGVLPVCLGKATKVCDLLTEEDKTYRCTMLLGIVTDTQDISGSVLEEKEVRVTEQEVEKTILGFVGSYDQIPPMYSALKVQGKKLYELARAGKEVERKPRPVRIHQITIHRMELPRVEFEVTCSRGTYIRTLCDDIGRQLQCGACMERLVRTRVADFLLEDSLTLAQIENMVHNKKTDDIVLPVDQLFSHLPKCQVGEAYQKILDNGNRIPLEMVTGWQDSYRQKEIRIYDSEGRFVGLYQFKQQEKDLKPVKIFYEKE